MTEESSSSGGNTHTYPSQNTFELGGVIFSSNFDNGNLLKVERGGDSNEYLLWTAADNYGVDFAVIISSQTLHSMHTLAGFPSLTLSLTLT